MRIAFIGIGGMGERMAGRLLDAGHDLVVYNRTTSRTQGLAERGAAVAATPRDAAAGADVAITMLADPPAVEQAAHGADGLLAGLASGTLWIDMSTVSPAASREFAAAAAEAGVRMIDAPVSGSLGAAARGLLVILAGGAIQDVVAARPVLDVLGRETVHVGPAGAGSATKLAVNGFLCTAMEGALEAVRLASSEGVENEVLNDALKRTQIMPAWVLSKLERVSAGDTRPAFALALALKDLRLIDRTAQADGLRLPVLDAVREQYGRAAHRGLGGQDFSAVGQAVEADR